MTVDVSTLGWGTVQDPDGNVQAAVAFTVVDGLGATVLSGVTDASGQIPGSLADGVYTLTVSGAAPATVDVVSGSVGSVKVDKARQPINVKDAPYSAVGDGAADDTAKLQAAFTAGAAAGRAVLIPAGTYKVTASLVVPNELQVVGEGRWHSVISMASGNTPILRSNDQFSHSVKLEDFALVYATQQTFASHPNSFGIGWSSTVTSPTESDVFYWTMKRLRIQNATIGIGVLNSGDSRLTMYVWNCHFEQILFQAITQTCIYTGDRGQPVNTFKMVTHVGAPSSAQTGPALKLQGEWVINGLDIEDWTGQLILADGPSGLHGALHGLHVERHTITQASASTLISLSNGKFTVKGVYYAAYTTATNFAHKLISTSAADLEYGNITVGDWGATGTLVIATGAATDSHLCTGGVNAFQDTGVVLTNGALATHIEGGAITLSALAAASAPINSLFRDSADGKLKWKDNGGTANALY